MEAAKATHCVDCEGKLLACDTCSKLTCTHCDGHVARDCNGEVVAVGCGACCTELSCRRARAHAATVQRPDYCEELTIASLALERASTATAEAWMQMDGTFETRAVYDACAVMEVLCQQRLLDALAVARDSFEARNG